MKNDIYYMRRAIKLAKKAEGFTSPNPLVGCLIVKKGKIIGKGYHHKAGLPHAEVIALQDAGEKAKNATMYVTLEPCKHLGRTPPCTSAVIKAGIKRFVIAMKDPNPLNNGRGITKLREKGASVTTGVCEKEAREINRPFIKYATKGLPFVTLKIAESLDGKIATSKGESKWISNSDSRQHVQKIRSYVDAIMVGSNTVIKDNPRLLPKGYYRRNPVRVVVDSRLKIPLDSKLVKTAEKAPLIIATTKLSSERKKRLLNKKNVNVIVIKSSKTGVNLEDLLKILGRMGILHILAEGGAELAGSLCDKKLVDRILFFISPKIIGGRDAITSIKGRGVNRIKDALKLENVEVKRFKDDVVVSGDI